MSRVSGIVNLIKDNQRIYDQLVVKGIKVGNKYTYRENDITVTILFEENKIKMKRVTSDYGIELIFDNNSCTLGNYYLKKYNKNLKLKVKTLKSFCHENRFDVEYLLFMEDELTGHFIFSLELEVKS